MRYRLKYYLESTQEYLGSFQSNFLPKEKDYVTLIGKRYVVFKVYTPFSVQEFAPDVVNITVKGENPTHFTL